MHRVWDLKFRVCGFREPSLADAGQGAARAPATELERGADVSAHLKGLGFRV
jgi:hypothetical protein